MKRTGPAQLKVLRTLLDADHALVFARRVDGQFTLVTADPPLPPSQPFALTAAAEWPDSGTPVVLSDPDLLRQSPLGAVLASPTGTVLAVADPVLLPATVASDEATELALYMYWQAPKSAPAHVFGQLAATGLALRESLRILQQLADFDRSRARIDALLSALPFGVVLTDEEAGRALLNERAAQLLSLQAGTCDAVTLAAAMHQLLERMSNAEMVRLDARALFATDHAARTDWVWEVLTPTPQTLLVCTAPVVAPRHRGRLWAFYDMTALRDAETGQHRLLRQLERERARVRDLMADTPTMIVLTQGPEHSVVFANASWDRAVGHATGHPALLFVDSLPHMSESPLRHAFDLVVSSGTPWRRERLELIAAAGDRRVYVDLSLQPSRDANGAVTGVLLQAIDVSTQVAVIEQRQQSQRLEAIGRLTGGVAHDFNNLLTVIGGNTDLLLTNLPEGTVAYNDAVEVREAVQRATDLTRQLLGFSRRHVLQRLIIEPDPVVRGVERMLRRIIGADVQLETQLDASGVTILMDPGQLEQILVNLAVNARDAMPGGGILRITTALATDALTDAPMAQHELHLRLTVSDTGTGMDADTLAHASEAFFTTKAADKGTGLGLAMVRDIVAHSGGAFRIDSTLGIGTHVCVALPVVNRTGGAAA